MKKFLNGIIFLFIVALSATTINAAYIVQRTNYNFVRYDVMSNYVIGDVSVLGTQYYQIGSDIYSAKKAHIELKFDGRTKTTSVTSNGIYDSQIRTSETIFDASFRDNVSKTGYITNTWVRNDVVISGTDNDK